MAMVSASPAAAPCLPRCGSTFPRGPRWRRTLIVVPASTVLWPCGRRRRESAVRCEGGASAAGQRVLRTCKNCKRPYDPGLNHPSACRFHTAHFGGVKRSRALIQDFEEWKREPSHYAHKDRSPKYPRRYFVNLNEKEWQSELLVNRGETKRKFESVYTGGTMDTPDAGKVFQYWHCCASEDPFDPGCTAAPHCSYDD